MIRRAISIALCSVTFFLIAFVIPAQAGHPFSTNFVCTSFDAAMTAATMASDDDTTNLVDRARFDPDFECYVVEYGFPFMAIELVHEYQADGLHKGVVRAIDDKGKEVFALGTITYINSLFHLAPERGV